MKKAFALGIIASFFFAFTFILNKQMDTTGGSWYYSASLRYLFMLPMLLILLLPKQACRPVLQEIRRRKAPWLLWSTVGFGLFYAPLCFASAYGTSWLVAGTWQITIVAGALMTPLFHHELQTESGPVMVRNQLPKKALLFSLVILLGIFLMQLASAGLSGSLGIKGALLGVFPVLIAAFAYPLGNRKMMAITGTRLSTLQRIFGMTLCSLPFWLVLFLIGLCTSGIPSYSQTLQSLSVALFSGIVATLLFFKATELAAGHPHHLAVIESTQAGEVLFTVLGGVMIFGDRMPTEPEFAGLALIVIGMILNSRAEG